MHQYNDEFFEYIERGSIASAKVFCSWLTPVLGVDSVLDVGCGRGAWLKEWTNSGVSVVHGADGPYVSQDQLLIGKDKFTAVNLAEAFNVGRRFDLVTSLEVAEHLPPSSSRTFIASLTSHADRVLFSAATQGQGGENHVNERPLWYWQELFSSEGFEAFDLIRPMVVLDKRVEPWYRFNSILFVKGAACRLLPAQVLATRVEGRVSELGDFSWKTRKLILRHLPISMVTALSRLNYHRLNRAHRRKLAAI